MDFKVVELNLKKQKSPKTRKGKSNERKRMKSTLKKTEKRDNINSISNNHSSIDDISRSKYQYRIR